MSRIEQYTYHIVAASYLSYFPIRIASAPSQNKIIEIHSGK